MLKGIQMSSGKKLTIMTLVVSIVTTGIIFAQSQLTLEDLKCDSDELVETQTELRTSLKDFEANLEENPETALADLYDTGKAYQQLALDCGFIPDDIGELTVGMDVEFILNALENINGDPLKGQLLYNGEEPAADGSVLGCVGCHSDNDIAPVAEGTWTRWDEIHSLEPEFEEYDFAHYVVESVVLPWDYIVPDYGEVMPNNFGDRLSFQDLADLISYLESQDQYLD
jgi:hypothetical protein